MKNDLVLVGVVRNREQLEANMDHSFYHIPAGNISPDKMPLRYVALYLSEATFGKDGGGVCYIGEVDSAYMCKRGDIMEIPTKHPDVDFFRFEIKKWHKFTKPIKLHSKINICTFVELSSLVTIWGS